MEIEYRTSLFKKETVQRLGQRYMNLLQSLCENPDVLLGRVDMLDASERRLVTEDFNANSYSYPRVSLGWLFDKQVKRVGDKVALQMHEVQMTYEELNRRSNQVAHFLRERVSGNAFVGLLSDRSMEMMIGMLGILKAGCAYVPLDPSYPADRISFMLKDSGSSILLTHLQRPSEMDFEGQRFEIGCKQITGSSDEDISWTVPGDWLAYLIYTSGSTGKPKGVMIEHRNVVNLIEYQRDRFGIDDDDRIVLFSSICFDASIEQIFLPLLSGATLVLVDQPTILDTHAFESYLVDQRITHLHAVPAFLAMLNLNQNYSLRRVIVGGDVCPEELIRKWARGYRFYNEYGPTEVTVTSVEFEVYQPSQEEEVRMIGKPVGNTYAYILHGTEVCGIGITGELCLGGEGLSRGYLNREELTTEKFVPNPFRPGERMYRTGDLARWRADGNIDFEGRKDEQVKVRGYRIEPGEIESLLQSYSGIKQAAVVARSLSGDDKELVGFYVSEEDIPVSLIRSHLTQSLPDYMVPSQLVRVDQMPLNTSGKIDRRSLRDRSAKLSRSVIHREGPRNEIEETVLSLWREVLKVDDIGIDDNFFELGGHSLKATVLVAKIHKAFDVTVPLRALFKTSTIRGISDIIRKADREAYRSILPAAPREDYPLSPAQQRIFILNELEGDSIAYNMPHVVVIEGDLDTNRLYRSFGLLLDRHWALRTSFARKGDHIVQRIMSDAPLDIEISSGTLETLREQIDNFIRPFDLGQAPLFRVNIIRFDSQKYLLIVDTHHIINDGVSNEVLISEFTRIYNGETLIDLKLQYVDYAVWQNESSNGKEIQRQENFWLTRLGGELPVLNLHSDFPRPRIVEYRGESISFEINGPLVRQVRYMSNESNCTLYMTLLAIYKVLLFKYTGQEDIIVGSPIAGRSHPDLEGVVGMFVNTLAVRSYPAASKSFRTFLGEIRETVLDTFENQDYQFEDLVDKLKVPRDTSRNPIFDVMFDLKSEGRGDAAVLNGLKVYPYGFDTRTSKFDMSVNMIESGDHLYMEIEYRTSLFKKETVQRLGQRYMNLL
ncbi:amino acid adenylation domain-containing protein, partial [Tolypothrix sp. VBCCA 56010]|uniref:amino acid adenylation domain-containing protein n=1 Tax=Tolypothrix sp. VBCCA 56010 TaxID=3137731 RepID=UPI003D7EF8BC